MSKKHFIKRHLLILERLRKNPCTFKELQAFIKKRFSYEGEEYEILKRTFERDVKEILSIYGVEIKFNRREKVYEIVQESNEGKTNRLMESYQMYNALSMSDSVANHLIVEKRKPLGTENMYGLLHAIQHQVEVRFEYEKFWGFAHEKNQRLLRPLVLKEARQRWYLIAEDPNDGAIKSFGLDRISDLEISSRRFEYPNSFNAEEKFKHAFGIISGEEAPEKIRLWLTREQGNYIKSLPLHASQKIVSETDSEIIIELFVCPTHDFVMELLSMGANVKVLEPKSLQKKVKARLLEAVGLYA
jgi:predicted DNA-binding transcriptional regulator YafY